MSLNLYFSVGSKKQYFLDFPFQTPTDLTIKMMAAKTKDNQIKVLRDSMKEYSWLTPAMVDKCAKMILDPDLTLTSL